MKKISSLEVEELYLFTKKHYVEYYDLQTELVDHLSNGIEVRWQENNNLSFEEALQLEFRKFGVFGFTDLVTERQVKMSKRYNKLILSILKTYFTIPRILLTIMLVLITMLILQYIPNRNFVLISLFVLPVFVLFFKTITYKMLQKKRKKHGEKLWMFEEVISSYGQTFLLFQLVVHIPQFLTKPERIDAVLDTSLGNTIVSIILVVFLLLIYIMLFVIPSKSKEHISKVHPEYNLV